MRSSVWPLVLALALAGCKSSTGRYSVEVTIRADAMLSDPTVATIRTLEIDVRGAETFHRSYPITTELAMREARWLYAPGVRGGTIDFAVFGLDANGTTIAYGELMGVGLVDGKAVPAQIFMTTPPPGDMGGACTPLPSSAAEFFVDPAAPLGGSGAADCPLRTLTRALALASTSTAMSRTIRLAAGLYDASSGEVFPLIVRRSISIEGASAATTVIRGSGALDRRGGAGPLDATYQVTLLTGGAMQSARLSKLTLQPSAPAFAFDSFGVLCDEGNSPVASATPPAPFPLPTLRLDQIVVGPSYYAGVVATGNGIPTISGCNLLSTASTFTGNVEGVFAVGCGVGNGASTPVAVVLGDFTFAGANTFSSNRSSTNRGVGVLAWDCATPVRVLRNLFDTNDIGLSVEQYAKFGPAFVQIEGNTFNAHSHAGIQLANTPVVSLMLNNSFTATYTGPSGTGAGLYLTSGTETSGGPIIRRARMNRFANNDTGIFITGNPWQGSVADFDFGSGSNLGANVFTCNSRSGSKGHDIFIQVGDNSTGSMGLAGNTWDHTPPSQASTSAAAVNGTDLVTDSVSPPTFDTTSPLSTPTPCTGGHVP